MKIKPKHSENSLKRTTPCLSIALTSVFGISELMSYGTSYSYSFSVSIKYLNMIDSFCTRSVIRDVICSFYYLDPEKPGAS